MTTTTEELDRRFLTSPRLSQRQRDAAADIRDRLHVAAQVIVGSTVACREQSLALTKLEEALGWALAAVEQGSADTGALSQ